MPVSLAKGVCPDALEPFFTQQYRWAMGSITMLLNAGFWSSNLTKMQKVSYFSGMLYYMASALSIFVNPLPAVLLVWIRPEAVLWYGIAFAIPSLLFSCVILRLWCKQKYGFAAEKVKNVQFYAHVYAIKDKLFGTAVSWIPTGGQTKGKSKSRYRSARMLCAFWIGATTGSVIGGSIWRILQGHWWVGFVPSMLIAASQLIGHLEFILDMA